MKFKSTIRGVRGEILAMRVPVGPADAAPRMPSGGVPWSFDRNWTDGGYHVSKQRRHGTYPLLRAHPGVEIHWVHHGGAQYFFAGQCVNLAPGDILVAYGSNAHALRPYTRSFLSTLIGFHAELLSDKLVEQMSMLRALPQDNTLVLHPSPSTHVAPNQLVESLLHEFKYEEPARETSIVALLQLLLVKLEREWHTATYAFRKGAASSNQLVCRVLAYIEEHHFAQMSLEELAAQLAFSPRHVNRCFAIVTGMSVMAFWQQRRLEAAALLLREGSSDVADLAAVTGYASVSAFGVPSADTFTWLPAPIAASFLLHAESQQAVHSACGTAVR